MGILDSFKSQGERIVSQVSAELMNNPRFMQAMQAAMKGKERLDQGVAQALKSMNVPTRSEFKRAQSRIEALEVEIQQMRAELRDTRRPKSSPRAGKPAVKVTRRKKASGRTVVTAQPVEPDSE